MKGQNTEYKIINNYKNSIESLKEIITKKINNIINKEIKNT